MPTEQVLNQIVETVENVKKLGFGEVRVLIKNGGVYRILTTIDKLVEDKKG